MCAIAGFVGSLNRASLEKMLKVLNHRGPDDSGLFIDGKVGLGNNRLSILDLSPNGHQPMYNVGKTVCIVYNGEIYNFADVRKKLEQKYKFQSHTDTEVILHAYEEWGVNCLKMLNGMFAFVVYDRQKDLLFGARDRLGEKPLKYYWDGATFVFASEVKAILSVLPKKPEIDKEAIREFLNFQYVPAPKTGFEKIFKLPPASYFIFQNKKLKISRYWNLDFSEKLNMPERDWEDEIFRIIQESVESRMVSDVPVGALLSGGVDSSAVVALMSRFTHSRIKTFSIGFDDLSFDETKYAQEVSKLYQTDHYSQKVGKKTMQDVLVSFCEYYDEPFSDNSLVPSLLLSKMAGEKVKVVLSGDGGDENFAGYERYQVVKFGQFYKNVHPILRGAIRLPAQFFDKTRLFTNTFDLPFQEKYVHYNPYFKKESKMSIRGYNNKLSDLDNALHFDIKSYLPEDLLYKVDIASMSASLEVRAPFLNYQLLELTAKMPNSLKIKNLQTKYIFKKVLKDKNLLPKNIINRKKRGFIMPVDKWLKGSMKGFVADQLASRKFMDLEILDDVKSVDKLNGNQIFTLLSLSLWLQKYS